MLDDWPSSPGSRAEVAVLVRIAPPLIFVFFLGVATATAVLLLGCARTPTSPVLGCAWDGTKHGKYADEFALRCGSEAVTYVAPRSQR